MNIKNIFILTLIILSTITISAQQSTSLPNKKRAIAAKLLIELDRTPKANNRNNGRSRKEPCCNDGIVAPSNYQILAFGLNSSWYYWEEESGDIGIPNPIPYIASLGSNWTINLYDGSGEFLSSKSAYVQDLEMLLSIDGLSDGKYFIEVEVEDNWYTTGFSIGQVSTPPTSTIIQSKN